MGNFTKTTHQTRSQVFGNNTQPDSLHNPGTELGVGKKEGTHPSLCLIGQGLGQVDTCLPDVGVWESRLLQQHLGGGVHSSP